MRDEDFRRGAERGREGERAEHEKKYRMNLVNYDPWRNSEIIHLDCAHN